LCFHGKETTAKGKKRTQRHTGRDPYPDFASTAAKPMWSGFSLSESRLLVGELGANLRIRIYFDKRRFDPDCGRWSCTQGCRFQSSAKKGGFLCIETRPG
jgi:hypothetical protein